MPSPVFIEGAGLMGTVLIILKLKDNANMVNKKSLNVYTICMLCMQTASVLQ